ncbi:Ig-like domain-containing protein [Stenotrophomonas humi]
MSIQEMTVIVSGVAGTSIARDRASTGEALAQTHGVIATAGSFPPAIETVLDDKGAKQGVIENGGHTDDGRPQISGKADAGVVVHIYNDSELIGKVTVGADETWSFIPRSPLVDGRHEISVVHEHPDGDVSDISAPYVIFVDKLAPETPIILEMVDDEGRITGGIAAEGITDDSRPTVEGTTEADATIIVYDKGKEIGRVQADSAGKWSFTPASALADGTHILEYVAVDQAGNQSGKSGSFEFVVDTRPELVNIHVADDDVGNITGTLVSGSSTDDATPTLRGTATAGGIVKIYEGNVLLGETTAGVDGRWTFTPATPLSEGPHALQATVTLPAKGESERSQDFNLIVDLSAPGATSIDEVIDNVGSQQGALANGAVTDDTTPTLHGKAAAGGTVKVYDGNLLLGSTEADAQGNWTFMPAQPLRDGQYNLSATVTTAAQGESARTEVFVLTVDATAPTAPTIVSVLDDVGNDGNATINVVNGGLTDDTQPEFKGKAEANSTVIIKDNGVEIGRVQANAAGDWTFTPPAALGYIEHTITVIAVDVAGNASVPSSSFNFTVERTPTQTATLSSIGKDSGFSDTDFLTNDGSAGRLMEGELSSELVAGQTLQVSTDGGLTWRTAFVSGTRWSAQDENTHADSWVVQMRVVGGSGAGEVSSQKITTDFVAPNPPTAIAVSGANTLDVSFEKEDVRVGDHIHMNVDGREFDYAVTANDVLAGKATIDTPFTGTILLAKASIVDQAGNSSHALLKHGATVVTEDFNQPGRSNIESLETAFGSVVKEEGVLSIGAYPGSLTERYLGSLVVGRTDANYDVINFKLNRAAKKITITLGSDNGGSNYFEFYDRDGNAVGRKDVNVGGNADGIVYVFTAPAETSVAYFKYFSEGEINGVLIDQIVVEYSQVLISNDDIFVTRDDAYLGSAAADVFVISDVSAVQDFNGYIKGNGGTDTLKLTGANQVLDLAALAGKLSSVEIIDITGTGNNTLKLSLADVLENGGMNQFVTNDRVQLLVKGNVGDSVVLSDLLPNGTDPGDWVKATVAMVDGVTYDSYQHSSLKAEILLQKGMTVTVNNTDAAVAYDGAEPSDVAGVDIAMLTLNVSQVLNEGGMDLFHEGDQSRSQMMVKGGAGDSINLDDLLDDGVTDLGDWAVAGAQTIDGVAYNVYQHSGLDAELLVQESVKVNLI